MSLKPTAEPQAMNIPDLQDYLIETAEAAKDAIVAQDFSAVENSRKQLQGWADVVTGPKLALIEVALAFLDNLVGKRAHEPALVAQRFLDTWPRESASFFDDLVRGHGVEVSATKRWPAGARFQLETLEKVGVLLRDEDHAYYLAPTSRDWLREMVEPVQFRMWRIVNSARARASTLIDNDARITALAILTGASESQARLHMERTPLPTAPRAVHVSGPRWRRQGNKAPEQATRHPRVLPNIAVGVPSTVGGAVRNDADAVDAAAE